MVSSVQSTPYAALGASRNPGLLERARFRANPREVVEAELRQAGGRHIVFVRSSEGRRSPAAWYYNGPRPEESPVLWAQEVDPVSDREFLNYYRGRRIWVVDADAAAPRLAPYGPRP